MRAMIPRVRVFAPACVSNLGPGFDVLGLAVGAPRRRRRGGMRRPARAWRSWRSPVTAVSSPATRRRTWREWLAPRCSRTLTARGLRTSPDSPGVRLSVHKQMPLASGLGSSAASSVAGAMAVNELFGAPLSKRELLAARTRRRKGGRGFRARGQRRALPARRDRPDPRLRSARRPRAPRTVRLARRGRPPALLAWRRLGRGPSSAATASPSSRWSPTSATWAHSSRRLFRERPRAAGARDRGPDGRTAPDAADPGLPGGEGRRRARGRSRVLHLRFGPVALRARSRRRLRRARGRSDATRLSRGRRARQRGLHRAGQRCRARSGCE